jgi:hypothetical protein
MWQRLYYTNFVVCQGVVSFLACYLATTVQKILFKAFLSWCYYIWIEKTATRHAKAVFFFQGTLFLKEANSYLFPNLKISHSQKAACWNLCDRLFTSGNFSEEAWFPEKPNVSVLHSDQISDRRKPIYGGTYSRQLLPQHLLIRRIERMYYMHS